MIIENQEDVTEAVLSELQRAPDARFREIMSAFVRHLHDFVREVKLTEEEFHAAIAYIVALGKHSNESHNEAVLMSGSLGLSALICLLNNGDQRHDGDRPEHARAVLAHAFAGHAERRLDRALAHARDRQCSSMPGSATRRAIPSWAPRSISGIPRRKGFYENQDPVQADMNLRGKFFTDEDGHISFRSVKPAGYPIPIDGPTGELLRAQGRHNMRPAHLHFLASKDGFKTLISQLYVPDDKFIETDVQFGVTRHLIGNYVRHENGKAPAPDVKGPWYSLDAHLRDGSRPNQAAAAADHRQGERRAAENPASGVRQRLSRFRSACTRSPPSLPAP